jgi:glycosyltransferase involved in cell wall biosynthesis
VSITVAICTYNAGHTLLKAIDSIDDPECSILIINDYSQDDTLELLQHLADSRLSIFTQPKNNGLSSARQTALDQIETDYGIWLDADDEFLPGRIKSLHQCLVEENYDLVFDQAEHWDGDKRSKIRDLPIPAFMFRPNAECRLFERNYLPAPGCPAFRVDSARKVGYDTKRRQSEDYDFNLRAIQCGLKFHFSTFTGYKLNAYDNSLSRNLLLQSELIRKTLNKFSLEEVRKLYFECGYSRLIAHWGVVLMTINRCEPMDTLFLLKEVEEDCYENKTVLEPNGPLPFPENWKWYFYSSISHLMLSNYQVAVSNIEKALAVKKSSELLNNLGFAYGKMGNLSQAKDFFQEALELNPTYNDAIQNEKNQNTEEFKYTRHPLRQHPSRMEYKL